MLATSTKGDFVRMKPLVNVWILYELPHLNLAVHHAS
jgi:hypothetical protein